MLHSVSVLNLRHVAQSRQRWTQTRSRRNQSRHQGVLIRSSSTCRGWKEGVEFAGANAYTLISEGAIRSIVLRRKGCVKGRRLVDVASVRRFLASMPDDIDPAMSANCRKAQVASQKAKLEKKRDKNGEAQNGEAK
jgi:hypothetical protein